MLFSCYVKLICGKTFSKNQHLLCILQRGKGIHLKSFKQGLIHTFCTGLMATHHSGNISKPGEGVIPLRTLNLLLLKIVNAPSFSEFMDEITNIN